MLSFDTNIAVHAANADSILHLPAKLFLQELATRKDVAVCELILVELYLKLRNEKIFSRPLSAADAASVCQSYRNNRAWRLIESAPVMDDVWKKMAVSGIAFRRIIDLRLAQTLRHHGVFEFATTNVKDFGEQGFQNVWNPLAK